MTLATASSNGTLVLPKVRVQDWALNAQSYPAFLHKVAESRGLLLLPEIGGSDGGPRVLLPPCFIVVALALKSCIQLGLKAAVQCYFLGSQSH